MQCRYFGQDILAFSVGIATYIASQISDVTLLNLVGDLFMLVGQQIVTIAGAKEYFCPQDKSDQTLLQGEQKQNKKPCLNPNLNLKTEGEET